MINSKNIVKHELIGFSVEIVDSKNRSNIGIKGKIVDETRNSLVIRTNKGEKTVIKDQCIFVFRLPEGKIRVDGELLVARPEDRIRKKTSEW